MTALPSPTEIVAGFVRSRLAASSRRPLLVGLCGAQGSGKTTMATDLAAQFNHDGVRTVVLSLDDLYLGAAERRTLAGEAHPMFAVRGVPATHDVELGIDLIERLARPGPFSLPRFDKATDDRMPERDWLIVKAPVDVILFEGWCVGARPQPAVALVEPINALEAERDPDAIWRTHVNEALAGPYRRLFAGIDLLVLLAAPGFDVVRKWRRQQEDDLRARSSSHATSVMSPEQIDEFIQYFERITRHVLADMPSYSDLVVHLNESRDVVAVDGISPA